MEGHEAKFTCEVTGLPRPEVTWYRNFREVFGGRHYKITSDGNVHMLVIKDLEEGEISHIECHAKNRCGSATTRAKLDVLGKTLDKECCIYGYYSVNCVNWPLSKAETSVNWRFLVVPMYCVTCLILYLSEPNISVNWIFL